MEEWSIQLKGQLHKSLINHSIDVFNDLIDEIDDEKTFLCLAIDILRPWK